MIHVTFFRSYKFYISIYLHILAKLRVNKFCLMFTDLCYTLIYPQEAWYIL